MLAMDYAPARQPDADHIRTWEVPGSAHVGRGRPLDATIAAGVRARDTQAAAGTGNPACQDQSIPELASGG